MNTIELPKEGLAGLKAHFKNDLLAGFTVSLIALPLCLGIAIASGVPPLAGLITAIVGGILASRVSGTFVTISGPAAGLIVITLHAMETMGGAGPESGYAGYASTLGAIIVAGIIMSIFGFLKIGKIGDFFPSAAVHGMLAAIGVIIIIKQIFPLLGVSSPKGEILEVALEIPHAFKNMSPMAGLIGGVSILILIVFPKIKIAWVKLIPSPMWVLLITVPMAYFINDPQVSLVSLPHRILGEGGIEFPSFAKFFEIVFWKAVIGFALVSSIETLLSAKAVDSLDPYQRKSDLNKDLVSMGLGSSVAASIGGLPMISEIVRSSANVSNGVKTTWSNFFHGTFLLIFLLAATLLIEMIPVSALAAMLVFTGFRLASPREFTHMFKIGMMELEIFVVTILAVLATDLIIGIAIGILFKYALLIYKGIRPISLVKCFSKVEHDGDVATIRLYMSLVFSNYLPFKKKLEEAAKTARVINLDFLHVKHVDHTALEHLEEFEKELSKIGKELHIINIEQLNPVSDHPLAARDIASKKGMRSKHINRRQRKLFDFALNNNFQYTNVDLELDSWKFRSVSLLVKLQKVENIVTSVYKGYHLQSADLDVIEGARLSANHYVVSVVRISGFEKLPIFYMQKETFVERMQDKLYDNDIDFESHPKFSENYSLIGEENEEDVKSFFKPALLSFFEQNPDMFLISNGKSLALHKGLKAQNMEDLENLHQKAKEIVDIL